MERFSTLSGENSSTESTRRRRFFCSCSLYVRFTVAYTLRSRV